MACVKDAQQEGDGGNGDERFEKPQRDESGSRSRFRGSLSE